MVTFEPMFSVEKFVQEKNTGLLLDPIEVQLVALKLTVVRPLQDMKTVLPMLVTEAGMVTEARFVHPEKAPLAMLVT